MFFITVLFVSNWMGSLEFRVQSSPDREVSIQLLPESPALAARRGYSLEHMTLEHTARPCRVDGNPFLTRGLGCSSYVPASCTLYRQYLQWEVCKVDVLENGTRRFSNFFTSDAMPDPVAKLEIVEVQPNLKELILHYEGPTRMGEVSTTEWTRPRHAFSNYEEECRFLNKSQ